MAKSKFPRVYTDSCLYLNVIKREPGLWADSLKVLLAADRGDIKLVASTLVIVEVSGWSGDVDPVKRDEVINKYLDERVEWYEVDRLVARDARQYCDKFKMRGPDATHLATAIRAQADWLMTRDTGFPQGQTVDGVRVAQPRPVWDLTLEDVDVDSRAEQEEAALRARTPAPRQRKRPGPKQRT